MNRSPLTFRGVLIASSVVMIAIYASSAMFARGGRTFFSPYTLETRSQTELLLPFTEIPIFRSPLHSYRYKLTGYLISHGYWTPAGEVSAPLMTNHWNLQWRDGHSDVHRQFQWMGDQWIEWSERHPQLAHRLWPCVLDLLRSTSEDSGSTVSLLLLYASIAQSDDQFNKLVATDAHVSKAIGITKR